LSEEVSEKIRNLPHMNDEHLEVLKKEGLTTSKKLLHVLKDEEKWKELHPKLKGIGPKILEKWVDALEPVEKPKEKVSKPEKIEHKVKAPAGAKVRRVVKKPAVEEKAEKAEPKEKAEEEEEEEEEPEEEEAEEEETEIVEEGEYVPHKKPKLPDEVADALSKKEEIAMRRPKFLRQEFHRYIRLRTGWRKAKGLHSKTRKRIRYRRKGVSAGYRSPKLSRGLHPSGFEEVQVFNMRDLEKISNPERQAARIGHGVGQRKRENIIDKADELGIRVLNRG